MKVEVQRQLDKEKKKLLEKAAESATEQSRLQLAAKQKVIDDMQKQIDDLKRKADVSNQSQKTQGDVQEADLAAKLTEAFPPG